MRPNSLSDAELKLVEENFEIFEMLLKKRSLSLEQDNYNEEKDQEDQNQDQQDQEDQEEDQEEKKVESYYYYYLSSFCAIL